MKPMETETLETTMTSEEEEHIFQEEMEKIERMNQEKEKEHADDNVDLPPFMKAMFMGGLPNNASKPFNVRKLIDNIPLSTIHDENLPAFRRTVSYYNRVEYIESKIGKSLLITIPVEDVNITIRGCQHISKDDLFWLIDEYLDKRLARLVKDHGISNLPIDITFYEDDGELIVSVNVFENGMKEVIGPISFVDAVFDNLFCFIRRHVIPSNTL